jgi:hypothetical protein
MNQILNINFYFLLIFTGCSTDTVTENSQSLQEDSVSISSVEIVNQHDSVNNTNRKDLITDSVVVRVESKANLWVEEWKKVNNLFSSSLFNKEWSKDIVLEWVDFDIDSEYFKSFKPMLKQSEDKLMSIDMYSYSTVLEETDDVLYANFNVDNKVFLVDTKEGRRSQILFTGSYEVLEECFWIGKNQFILLGYIDDGEYQPFIWYFDIKNKKQVFYSYSGHLENHIEGYFFKKFPQIKLRTE